MKKVYVHYEGSKGPCYSNVYHITSSTSFNNVISSFISDYKNENKILLSDRNIDIRSESGEKIISDSNAYVAEYVSNKDDILLIDCDAKPMPAVSAQINKAAVPSSS